MPSSCFRASDQYVCFHASFMVSLSLINLCLFYICTLSYLAYTCTPPYLLYTCTLLYFIVPRHSEDEDDNDNGDVVDDGAGKLSNPIW